MEVSLGTLNYGGLSSNFFLLGNHPKIVLYQYWYLGAVYHTCILFPCTLLKDVSYYDLSVLFMSVMDFPKKWGQFYPVLFWVFLNFAKPLSDTETRVARRRKGVLTQSGNLRGYTVEHSSPCVSVHRNGTSVSATPLPSSCKYRASWNDEQCPASLLLKKTSQIHAHTIKQRTGFQGSIPAN